MEKKEHGSNICLYKSRSIVSNQFNSRKPINTARRPDDDGHNGRIDGERGREKYKDKLSKPWYRGRICCRRRRRRYFFPPSTPGFSFFGFKFLYIFFSLFLYWLLRPNTKSPLRRCPWMTVDKLPGRNTLHVQRFSHVPSRREARLHPIIILYSNARQLINRVKNLVKSKKKKKLRLF